MLPSSLPSLKELCGIRITYLMWTHQDITKKCFKELLFDELISAVLSDVHCLSLPDHLKAPILQHVRPAGKHLLSVTSFWLSNTLPENSPRGLTNDMLFECLVLNGDGLINQRKTAEKILSSRVLHNVFAFRLACINFLKNEVLKLWILVRQYFLSKIMLEHASLPMPETLCPKHCINLIGQCYNMSEYSYLEEVGNFSHLLFTKEREEVLFWVSFCFSKENAITVNRLPTFQGHNGDWYKFALESAAVSGNVACFEYLNNLLRGPRRQYNYVDSIKKMFLSQKMEHNAQYFDLQVPSFIFLYKQLNSVERSNLFREFTSNMLHQFLQWPLSLMFLEDLGKLWSLVPAKDQEKIFAEIFEILYYENFLINLIQTPKDEYRSYSYKFRLIIPGIYSFEHLVRIWVALWNISSDPTKLNFLDSYVFRSVEFPRVGQQFRENFVTSGLKEKLLQLFLSNGQAILELFERENMKESLRILVARYMPEHFDYLDRQCISFFETQTIHPEIIRKEIVKAKEKILAWREEAENNRSQSVNECFLNSLKKYSFLSNNDVALKL